MMHLPLTFPGKIPLAWLLLVSLPLGLLTVIGLRLVEHEAQTMERRFQILLQTQLQAVDAVIQEYFQERERELQAFVERGSVQTEALRDYIRRQPRVRQLLVLAADGQRLHPPAAPLSRQERQFLERTEGVWEQDGRKEEGSAADNDQGWLVWPWGRETGLIFRQRDRQGRLFGFELEPLRLLADVIGRLPASDKATLLSARVSLLDGRGALVYQWGDYSSPEDSKPQAILPLSAPLRGWRLVYHSPVQTLAQQRLQWLLTAGFIAVGVAVAGLALYLYREHMRAERLARQRVNFVNQVSHELKTPLTNVRMYAELLQQQLEDGEDTAQRYVAIIVSESERLSRLIGNVLSFARQQRGRLQLHRRPVQVDEIIARVLAAFRPALDAKQVRIDFSPAASTEVSLDPDALEQILNNLLGNVEKYAYRGRVVEIVSRQEENRLRITVQDYGPGIPQRDRERVFRPFSRLSERLDEGATGTGIGLSIARELARLHGGELCLKPSAQGACFELHLPLEPIKRT